MMTPDGRTHARTDENHYRAIPKAGVTNTGPKEPLNANQAGSQPDSLYF